MENVDGVIAGRKVQRTAGIELGCLLATFSQHFARQLIPIALFQVSLSKTCGSKQKLRYIFETNWRTDKQGLMRPNVQEMIGGR